MNNKNERAERQSDAQIKRLAKKVGEPDHRWGHRNAALPYPCNPHVDGIFAGRPPMWHLPPSLF